MDKSKFGRKRKFNDELLLSLFEYSPLSNVAIGAEVGVSEATVRNVVKAKEAETGVTIERLGKDINKVKTKKALEDLKKNSRINELENDYGAVGEIAVKIFDQIVETYKNDIQVVDMILLAAFSNSYSDVLVLQREVAFEGKILSHPKGTTYSNPKYNILCREQNNMISLAKDLGLSVLSRKRAGVLPSGEHEHADSIFNFTPNDKRIVQF